LGSAMADVVVDAMIAEAVRYDKYVCIFNSMFRCMRQIVTFWLVCLDIDIVNIAKMLDHILEW
jgi:D-alanyl-lipoteichoic acid acyltransferase DltB (MBOAT superfamily)